jgi:hypothetical protein
MSENCDRHFVIGAWSKTAGFTPVDLENLIPVPDEIRDLNYDVVVISSTSRYLAPHDWKPETLEDLAMEAELLERRHRGEIELEIAPGFGLLRFLGSVVPRSFRERELDALHADAIELYFEKLDARDKWGAWRVKWSMRFWMLWSVFGGALGAAVSMLIGKQQPSK